VTRLFLERVPEPHREAARIALSAALGSATPASLERVTGGASGALLYRVDADGGTLLLRIDTRRDALRNPHHYECMRIAADAGIAPRVRYLDADAQVVVMDFLRQRPLAQYPGGPRVLARDLGALVARLQQTPAFPRLHEFPAVIARMLAFLRSSGLFAEGLLDAHAEGFERIREAYAWDGTTGVSSHNDPNPRNVVFDGDRLWLVDWEASCRNDPLTDVAILLDNVAATPELERALLEAWHGGAPGPYIQARILLMRQLTRLYYAGLLFSFSMRGSRPEPETDLKALTPEELALAVGRGELTAGSPEMMRALGKMFLARFHATLATPESEGALTVAAAG